MTTLLPDDKGASEPCNSAHAFRQQACDEATRNSELHQFGTKVRCAIAFAERASDTVTEVVRCRSCGCHVVHVNVFLSNVFLRSSFHII